MEKIKTIIILGSPQWMQLKEDCLIIFRTSTHCTSHIFYLRTHNLDSFSESWKLADIVILSLNAIQDDVSDFMTLDHGMHAGCLEVAKNM